MKNFKYLIYLFVGAFIFTSCKNDGFDPAEVSYTPSSEVNIGFDDMNDNQLVLEDGGTVSYNLKLSRQLPVSGTATIKVTSSDGSLTTTPGVQEVAFQDTFTFAAGETDKTVDLVFSNDMISDSEVYTIEVSNFVFETQTTEFYIVNGPSFSRSITVVDVLPIIVDTTVADVDFNFSWVGTSDLDCRIRNSSNATIDTGYSVSPNETVTLPASAPDGVYTFSIRPWTVNDPSIDFTVDFVSPAGTETFMGTLMNASGSWTQEDLFLEIEKTTNGSDVRYIITQL